MVRINVILGILVLVIGISVLVGELSSLPEAYEFLYEEDMYESLAEARSDIVLSAINTLYYYLFISITLFYWKTITRMFKEFKS